MNSVLAACLSMSMENYISWGNICKTQVHTFQCLWCRVHWTCDVWYRPGRKTHGWDWREEYNYRSVAIIHARSSRSIYSGKIKLTES